MEYRLPSSLADAARQFEQSGATPVTPKLASTVMLLREPFEVYLLRRVATMAFAPSQYVFPGGSTDRRDAVPMPGWAGPSPSQWAQRLRLDEADAQLVVCAAVRELFEEAGVLLAGPDAGTLVEDVSGQQWEQARLGLIARELSLAEFLTDRGLALRSDLLVPWSRWVTPPFEPRRFDTFFFLARLPVGQLTRDIGGEADHWLWCPPQRAVDDGLGMMPPTRATLLELAACGGVDETIAAADARDPGEAIHPVV